MFCAVKNCNNTESRVKKQAIIFLHFHNFPKDDDLRQSWIDFCGQNVVGSRARVCSEHFLIDDYKPNTGLPPTARMLLKPGVVPTIISRADYGDRVPWEQLENAKSMPSSVAAEPEPIPKRSRSDDGLTPRSSMMDNYDVIEVKIEPCIDPLDWTNELERHSAPASKPVSVRNVLSMLAEPTTSNTSTSLTTISNTLIDDDELIEVKVEPDFDPDYINVEDTPTATTPTIGTDIPHRPLSGGFQEDQASPRHDDRLIDLIRERNELLRQQNDLLQKMHSSTESYRSEVLAHYKEMRQIKRRKLANNTSGEDGEL